MAGEDYYMVWYRFERPMTAIEFSDAYAFLIEDTVSRPKPLRGGMDTGSNQ